MITDVVEVAWRANGQPDAAPATLAGRCARCGTADALTPSGQVVSRNFTAYDDWCNPTGSGLCRACTWAYRSPMLRTLPHLVLRWPELLTPLDTTQLCRQLRHPVTPNATVVVPLRPGRKHLLSGAAWGHVVTEEHLLTWTASDADHLATVERLLHLGYRPSQLLRPAPPYQQTARLDPAGVASVIRAWDELRCWRQRPVWMAVALRALRASDDRHPGRASQ